MAKSLGQQIIHNSNDLLTAETDRRACGNYCVWVIGNSDFSKTWKAIADTNFTFGIVCRRQNDQWGISGRGRICDVSKFSYCVILCGEAMILRYSTTDKMIIVQNSSLSRSYEQGIRRLLQVADYIFWCYKQHHIQWIWCWILFTCTIKKLIAQFQVINYFLQSS